MIPDWLQDKLATVPNAGAGIHAWLFSVARQLHAHMPADAIGAVLQAATTNAGRKVTTREIRDAVQNSLAVAWQPTPGAKSKSSARRSSPSTTCDENTPGARDRWPKPDAMACRCRVRDSAESGVTGLVDLWERSPALPDWAADDWLDWLFPSAEWLCLATDHPATARSRRREKWSFGPADQCGLVVPSPMTGPSGKGLDGRTSHRCLDNTGPRRWLVIEFDSGSVDEQAALHWHFREAAVAAGWPPLRLCVHSGGKSLHGWYGPCSDEAQTRDLMAYAVSLGADPATWNRCQLIRLPGGQRRTSPGNPVDLPDGWEQPGPTVRLEVFFFDPTPCLHPLSSSSTAPGGFSVSTPARALMAAA